VIAGVIAIVVIARLLISFFVAWLVMLLLPAAGAPALGYSQVLAGTFILSAISLLFDNSANVD
jgi:hypothetical protein